MCATTSKPSEFCVIIPARLASSRLPNKPLLEIAGKPMIYHTWHQAQQAGAQRVIVATDHPSIKEVVEAFGGEVCLTSSQHNSGTERLREVVEKIGLSPNAIVVNVQGDEPLIPPAIIRQVANNLAHRTAPMATLAVPICSAEDLFNPNVVKVVRDQHNFAMYFSRAVIPFARDEFAHHGEILPTSFKEQYLRHIGIYAYRAGFIQQYVQWKPSPLEQLESLEQLRVLWYGEKIHLDIACEEPAVGVDTPEDLMRVRKILE